MWIDAQSSSVETTETAPPGCSAAGSTRGRRSAAPGEGYSKKMGVCRSFVRMYVVLTVSKHRVCRPPSADPPFFSKHRGTIINKTGLVISSWHNDEAAIATRNRPIKALGRLYVLVQSVPYLT